MTAPAPHRFCVVAQARSGSEYFTTRLHAHPAIACHREIYNRRRLVSPLTETPLADRLPNLESRDRDPLGALRTVLALSAEAWPERTHVGFKLFLSHPPEVRRHVRQDLGWRLVLLERRNKLAQYASFVTARKTHQWGARAGDAPAPLVTVELDLDELDKFVRLERQRYANFRGRLADRPGVLELHSEDIDRRFPEVLRHLGVDASLDVPGSRVRQNPAPLSERVTNWDAVRRWLEPRGLAAWAEEDAAS